MMKKNLQNILLGVGVIFTTVTTFLGALYWLKGDILISGLIATVLSTAGFFSVQILMEKKKAITIAPEPFLKFLLWSLFTISAFPSSLLILHCFNVELGSKQGVQELAAAKMKAMDRMLVSYDSAGGEYAGALGADLRRKMQGYVMAIQGGAYPIAQTYKEQMKAKPFNLTEAQVRGINGGNYSRLADDFTEARLEKLNQPLAVMRGDIRDFLDDFGASFDSWTRLKLNYAFYRLDRQLASNLSTLRKSFSDGTGKTLQFSFQYPQEQVYMDHPLQLWQKNKPYYLLVLVLFSNLLVLSPYLLEEGGGKRYTPVRMEDKEKEKWTVKS